MHATGELVDDGLPTAFHVVMKALTIWAKAAAALLELRNAVGENVKVGADPSGKALVLDGETAFGQAFAMPDAVFGILKEFVDRPVERRKRGR